VLKRLFLGMLYFFVISGATLGTVLFTLLVDRAPAWSARRRWRSRSRRCCSAEVPFESPSGVAVAGVLA
jgi:hypothetical protein